MYMVGAPKALLEFNETIYLADGPLNINKFNQAFNQLSGGTYITNTTELNPNSTYKIQGQTYTSMTSSVIVYDANETRADYPINDKGYPKAPSATTDYFFEMGSGWFEQTPKHRAVTSG